MKKQSQQKILFSLLGFAFGAMGGLAIYLLFLNSPTPPMGPTGSMGSTTSNAKNGKQSTSKPLNVTVTMPRQEVVLDGIRSVGSLLPIAEVELSAEISGKVSAILFKEGQKVQKGQSLVKINDDDLQAKMKRYEHQEVTLKEKLERQRILLTQEAVSQEAYDLVQTEYNVLRADMEVLKVDIFRSVVRAPFDGVVGLRYVSEGAYVQPATRIAQLVDNSVLLVEFSIPEKYISTPLIGQKIIFTTEGSDRRNEAVIYAMEPKIDDATRSIILRARFNNSSGRIRPGMTARITIPSSAEATRMLIPSETIVPTMSGKSVWVIANGVASERAITTGIRLERDVEVLSGISLNDTVIVNGIMQVREGLPVVVKQ